MLCPCSITQTPLYNSQAARGAQERGKKYRMESAPPANDADWQQLTLLGQSCREREGLPGL